VPGSETDSGPFTISASNMQTLGSITKVRRTKASQTGLTVKDREFPFTSYNKKEDIPEDVLSYILPEPFFITIPQSAE
jgi:hypothetical protein